MFSDDRVAQRVAIPAIFDLCLGSLGSFYPCHRLLQLCRSLTSAKSMTPPHNNGFRVAISIWPFLLQVSSSSMAAFLCYQTDGLATVTVMINRSYRINANEKFGVIFTSAQCAFCPPGRRVSSGTAREGLA